MKWCNISQQFPEQKSHVHLRVHVCLCNTAKGHQYGCNGTRISQYNNSLIEKSTLHYLLQLKQYQLWKERTFLIQIWYFYITWHVLQTYDIMTKIFYCLECINGLMSQPKNIIKSRKCTVFQWSPLHIHYLFGVCMLSSVCLSALPNIRFKPCWSTCNVSNDTFWPKHLSFEAIVCLWQNWDAFDTIIYTQSW